MDRAVGRTELRVPPIVLGAMARRDSDDGSRIELFVRAIEAGLSAIDTAPLYDFGRAERQLGAALRQVGNRTVQVLTKVGLRWDDDHGDVLFPFTDAEGRPGFVRRDSRPDSIRMEVLRSLDRLGLDTLDLVQIHQFDPCTPIAASMEALLGLREEGRLRHIGVSNFSAAQIRKAARALGDVPLCSVQPEYSLVRRDAERSVLPACRELGVGVLAYSPLAEGVLAGRAKEAEHRALVPLRKAINDTLEPIARARDVPVATVALAWVVSRPGVTAAITGASDAEQLDAHLLACSLELDEHERARIDRRFERVTLPHDWAASASLPVRIARRGRAALARTARSLGLGGHRSRGDGS